jgi:signal transduction histidine kinase
MVNEAKSITATSLYRRLPEGKDELEQLAATFNNMFERLDQSFGSQKSFVSNLAHEVRTPLAGILGEIDLCLEKPRKSEEYIRVLNAVQDDARRISRLMQSLLDLAQAGYDSSAIQFTQIRIDEVVVDALVEVQQSRKDSLIEFSIKEDEISETDLSIVGNEYLLKVAFINVLENACKFSENKKVEVRIYRDQNKTCVAIIDHGPGISVKDQERLFELFYRGKTSQPGTGIGLSLTRRIVEQHQAELHMISKEGEGSTFIFSFGN